MRPWTRLSLRRLLCALCSPGSRAAPAACRRPWCCVRSRGPRSVAEAVCLLRESIAVPVRGQASRWPAPGTWAPGVGKPAKAMTVAQLPGDASS